MRAKTPYMVALRERILKTAMNDFTTKGIKAVKMDDIAKDLGISKRTLYELYENKEILLYEGVKKYKEQRENEMTELYRQCPDIMDTILNIYRKKVEEFKKTCPDFYADIAKYPSVQELFRQDRKQSLDNFVEFLKRGIDEGYFRRNLNLELVAALFTSAMEFVMQNQLYKNYSIEDIFHNIVFVSLRGFCTLKGVERLDSY